MTVQAMQAPRFGAVILSESFLAKRPDFWSDDNAKLAKQAAGALVNNWQHPVLEALDYAGIDIKVTNNGRRDAFELQDREGNTLNVETRDYASRTYTTQSLEMLIRDATDAAVHKLAELYQDSDESPPPHNVQGTFMDAIRLGDDFVASGKPAKWKNVAGAADRVAENVADEYKPGFESLAHAGLAVKLTRQDEADSFVVQRGLSEDAPLETRQHPTEFDMASDANNYFGWARAAGVHKLAELWRSVGQTETPQQDCRLLAYQTSANLFITEADDARLKE